MTDIVNSRTRSRMMAGIRGKNTKPELALRRSLHTLGFRYRLHANGLPGKPDLALPKYKAVIFVHGCFWHRHPECRYASNPSTRSEFWVAKFAANVARDRTVRLSLLQAGWRVAIVWECALRTKEGAAFVLDSLSDWLRGRDQEIELNRKVEDLHGHHASDFPEAVSNPSLGARACKHSP